MADAAFALFLLFSENHLISYTVRWPLLWLPREQHQLVVIIRLRLVECSY